MPVESAGSVSALFLLPKDARVCFVFAHGAGAGMAHPFMAATASGLAERGIATLRYQFPFMERGSKRTDAPPLAHATVRAAVTLATGLTPDLALFAGGKSFGGRMTSQTQALSALPGVAGLVFVGFPLHPAGKPARERGEHLLTVQSPMLFLQGTRDELADMALLGALVERLGERATLKLFDDADHSFHVRASSGRTDEQVRAALLDAMAGWMVQVVEKPEPRQTGAGAP
jgi:predicted alpha/beta-hydrolase family hydrolase